MNCVASEVLGLKMFLSVVIFWTCQLSAALTHMDNRFVEDEHRPVAAAAQTPGRNPSGAGPGGGAFGPWPGPAGAPRSDSLAPPNCSGTAACKSTAVRGSHGLRGEGGGEDTVIIQGEIAKPSITVGQTTSHSLHTLP